MNRALRREMVRIGRLLYERQYIVAAEGNLSQRLGGDHFLVTPAGRCKGRLAPEDLLEITLDGVPCAPAAGRPSSEWLMHREIYGRRPDVVAVCHGHPPFATACAAAHLELAGDALTESAATLGDVPLAAPAAPGTAEVPASIHDLIGTHDAILLANHGVVAVGISLEEAYFRLECVERLAQATLLAKLGGGVCYLPPALVRSARSAGVDGGVSGKGGQAEPHDSGQHQQ